jgi:hypothetical protein
MMSMFEYFKHVAHVDSWNAWFPYCINLIKISSMEITNSSYHVNITTKTCQFLFQEVGNP